MSCKDAWAHFASAALQVVIEANVFGGDPEDSDGSEHGTYAATAAKRAADYADHMLEEAIARGMIE